MTQRMTRRAFCAGAAAVVAARPAWSAEPDVLTARPASVQLAPAGYPETAIWGYDGLLPGPAVRACQGERISRRLVNELPVPTSVHWHGIRIDNGMDGVAGLTQDAVPPGGSFDYDFAVPDAGTYWYHAHANSMEQVARGLAGALIVEEPAPPDVDWDEVLLLDDWLLDPETGSFAEPMAHPMMMSHAGRTGNLLGTNGRPDLSIPARRHERLRLRLINTANARIFVLRLEGLEGWQVALDGMPLEAPEPVTTELVLAPAQRIDLLVDITADSGETAALLRLDDDDAWRPQVTLPVSGRESRTRRGIPDPLPPNPSTDQPDLTGARRLDMVMEGGAMSGMRSARYQGEELGFRALAAQGQYWALAGQAGLAETPFARLSRGEPLRLNIDNRTVFPHAMHLHGMHFRTVAPDGTQGPLRDTVLSLPGEPMEIAFTADNPGKWLFHCHMLGHAASGMTTWIDVT
ncbi:multicopper oxidase family protein [Histidinibacterium aquaticum]|uniref:Multicopper oxidase family protein n=1 Tax=Histidinibacterium aquaticum TaxID=2613962 RepID=A0A5J5GN34_9RHOB|nr:multicopper oxidase family protein [Histidinibacterium aquaticum]KAA9008852.1 multicopper oxidase family protein [Histidinibacterium aquaticum]